MHYVITGGCGFIGSHLARALAAQGHSLTVIDDLSTGRRENLSPGATLVERDIAAPGAFDGILEKADGVFHLAAIVSVQRSFEDWRRCHEVNLGGTVALLEALARLRRKVPVVLASSAAVYGTSKKVPLKETAICAPISPYGADKLASEWQASIAAKEFSIPTACLRFFNVYGPGQDAASPYSGVISIFADRMKRHEPITIFGDGRQARDFIEVSDIVAGLTRAMAQLETRDVMHGVFNLCTGKQTTVNVLAKTMARLTGSRSKIIRVPARTGDIRISAGNTALGKNKLGFKAGVRLEAGLRRLLESA